MSESWQPRFNGEIEGRRVSLSQYEPSGELRVETTQKGTETTEGYKDEKTTVFPAVISDGESIEVEAATPEQLIAELQTIGFSPEAAQEIARHGRRPAST